MGAQQMQMESRNPTLQREIFKHLPKSKANAASFYSTSLPPYLHPQSHPHLPSPGFFLSPQLFLLRIENKRQIC